MSETHSHNCSCCDRLEAENEQLRSDKEQLEAKVQALENELAKAKKHSGNSSKPPSGDVTSPPKDKNKTKTKGKTAKRKRGGQFGHKKHTRPPFDDDQIDHFLNHNQQQCPCCGGELEDTDEPTTFQQIEIPDIPVNITEHQRNSQYCHHCDTKYRNPFPKELVDAGLVGPRLSALIGYLKGACHMSFSTIRKFFRDVIGIPLSRGLLAKVIAKVSAALSDPYEELLKLLPEQDRLNVDETGHKDNGEKLWTWCFRALLFTLYKISPSRGSAVLLDVLGEDFDGILGCDYFSAYRKYMKLVPVKVQFCLAHFIRDVKFLAEHPNAQNKDYGQRVLKQLRRLFGVIHRRESFRNEQTFQRRLKQVRDELIWEVCAEGPETKEAQNLGARFEDHAESYFRFITEPDVEPTNNLAEQAIRFVAIHRRLTQGTRGKTGQTWCERIWTVISTCQQQGRSVFDFLCQAVTAYFRGEEGPSLLPNTS